MSALVQSDSSNSIVNHNRLSRNAFKIQGSNNAIGGGFLGLRASPPLALQTIPIGSWQQRSALAPTLRVKATTVTPELPVSVGTKTMNPKYLFSHAGIDGIKARAEQLLG